MKRIVDRDRQMVAGRCLLAGQHDISVQSGIDLDPAMRVVGEGQWTCLVCRFTGIEPQRVGAPLIHPLLPLRGREAPANSRIAGVLEAMRGFARGGDFRPRAEARIKQPALVETSQRGRVIGEMFRLAADRPLPVEAKPGQVFAYRGLEFRAISGAVDVFDAQDKASALPSRRAPGKESRMSVSEVKPARRARRKAGGERIHDVATRLRESPGGSNQPVDPGLVALAELGAGDADIAAAWAIVGDPPPRARPKGFPGLIGSVLAQQVSAASARAIWTRLNAVGPLTPKRFLALGDADLRAIGFSRGKMLYARGIAEAIVSGRLNLRRLHSLPDEEAIAELMELKGIGRWTAEIYLLFGLQRLDVWPADDLALQVAVQKLKRLNGRPNRLQLVAIAEPWRPWRGVAARFLWHYYHRTGRKDDPAPTQG